MGEYIKPFDEEFLKRTRSIIAHADLLKYNVTLILNCTLSLICLPIERSNAEYNVNPQGYDSLFSDLCAQLRQDGVVITETTNNTPNKQLLKCLRNGIAHIKMNAVNDRGQITGVEITGSTKHQNTTYSCTFQFTKKQLKNFANFMVKRYLQGV